MGLLGPFQITNASIQFIHFIDLLKEYKKDKKPGGVTADDGVGVVLAHRGAAGNAEKDDEDEVGGEEDDEGVVYKEGDCG